MVEERKTRTSETRDNEKRTRGWQRPSALPEPPKKEGVSYRWVRTTLLGEQDNRNASMRFREGYVPVKASEFPDLQVMSDINSQFPENIVIGGLMLCAIPSEIMKDRNRQMTERNGQQLQSVDRNFMRENDPRMPLLKPERRTQVKFGD